MRCMAVTLGLWTTAKRFPRYARAKLGGFRWNFRRGETDAVIQVLLTNGHGEDLETLKVTKPHEHALTEELM